MDQHRAALLAAAKVIDVPGTPRDLRVDSVDWVEGSTTVRWSFATPGAGGDSPARLRGEHRYATAGLAPEAAAQVGWAAAQLSAAHAYLGEIDGDWTPGEPWVRPHWTPERAWQALLAYFKADGPPVRLGAGPIDVVDSQGTIFRFDPVDWAEYLNQAYRGEQPPDAELVPVATRLLDDLPGWAHDELMEANCYDEPLVELIDGRLVSQAVDDDEDDF